MFTPLFEDVQIGEMVAFRNKKLLSSSFSLLESILWFEEDTRY